MKYYQAVTWIEKLKDFQNNVKGIDIEKADKKRDGQYSIALEQLEDVLDGNTDMEDIFGNPDNVLRNIMMLAFLDKTNASTRKTK